MSERRLDLVEIVDWYDGPVIAFVRTSWRPGLFLASLLAWDLPARRRVLALVPLAPETVVPTNNASDWDARISFLGQVVDQADGRALLVSTEHPHDNVVSESDIAIRDVRPDLLGDVDTALSPDRRKWLTRVGR